MMKLMTTFAVATITITFFAMPVSAAQKTRRPSSVNQQLEATKCNYYGTSGLVPGGTLIETGSSSAYNSGCRDGGGLGSCQSGAEIPEGKDCCHCKNPATQ